MNFRIELVQPFGAIIHNNDATGSIEQFTTQQLLDWVSQYKLIVFRGYETMPKQTLALFGQRLGKPLQWVFGAINELKVKADTENYIFTDHDVPMHWDGAFAGKIPHVILFQCIVAPAKEDMGGTTFADTEKILTKASDEQLVEWKNISIKYKTKKIVHYGGTITQSLIAKHEVENKQVIRYAEPVDDLNPVTLEISGLNNKSPEQFISEMKSQLYDASNLYTHRWDAGDIVLADNHTLLHGREAFKNPNERFIQRINILHRPQYFSLKRYLENCLTIRRKEFFVAELPIFLIPLLMNITGWGDFSNPLLYAGLAAIILLFNIGDMINCYEDYELDSIFKSHLSNAVYELGKTNVKWQIIVSGIIAIILTGIVAFFTTQYYLIPLTILGTIIGLQYSAKPFKFKSQGWLQLICLWGIIFFGPMLYTAIITNGFPGILQLLIFAAYGFQQMGIIMLNTAEDYTEDKAVGLHTIIVHLGFHKAMNFAYKLVFVSGLCLQLLLLASFVQHHTPWYLFASIAILTVGWGVILKEYKIIISKINSMNEDDAIKEIKKNGMMVPRWLKIGAYTTCAIVFVFFIWNLYR